MFLLLLLVTAVAIAAGFIATREAFRSEGSPEALIAMLAIGLLCAALLGSAAPITIPAAVGALVGLAVGLRGEYRRRTARPTLVLISDAPGRPRVERRRAA